MDGTFGSGLERKFCQMDAALTVKDGAVIEGYASLFNRSDQGGDVVQPGAYSASLKALASAERRVKMLWQHDPTQPIGVWDEVREDERGLYVKGRILTDVEKGREAAALIEAGAIDGLSIGYRTKRAEKDARGQRLLHDLELWEVSLVTFPMLPEARVGAKGESPEAGLMRELAGALEAARREMAAEQAAGPPPKPLLEGHEAMSTAETKARTGQDMPEFKTAMTGFLSDFRDFQAEIKTRIHKQEERLTMLDRKTMIAGRPALATSADVEGAPHQKAFEAYLRSGNDDALRGLEFEGKALSTAVAADGGYLVDPETAETVRSVLKSDASIRAIANVVNVESTSFDVLIDHGEMGSGWATETASTIETDTPQIERITIPLHELSAMPKASQRLLDDSAFDIDGWLAGRIADKFARAEAAAFINGDGVDKPTGFQTYPTVDNDVWTWGNIGYVPTGADGAFAGADALIDLVYALGAQYRAAATFVMNSKTAGTVRKLKDGDGRFLWSDGLSAGEPARLLGYPVLIAEDMPDIASGTSAVAFGDFSAGYTIAERPDLRVLRDPFSAKPHVLFYATKRVGGDVSDFAAIKVLKFSAS